MSALISAADWLAEHAHKGQKRRYTGDDYIVHPRSVAHILKMYGVDDDLTIAGALAMCYEFKRHSPTPDWWPST